MARVDLSDTWVAAEDAATLEVKVLDFSTRERCESQRSKAGRYM